jgi:lanosterol synthase
MGYLYGSRATAKETPLIKSLRQELYPMAFEDIDWLSCRDYTSPLDKYMQPHWVLGPLWTIMNVYERNHSSWVRKKALALALEHIRSEDRNTNWIDIGPVNKVMNMLSIWFAEGSDSENFKKHRARVDDYLWLAGDGMKMQGYNGSQLWDTAFCVQAIVGAGFGFGFQQALSRAHHYLDITQVPEDVPEREKYYRRM